MKLFGRRLFTKLTGFLVSPGLEPAQQAARIQTLQRDVVLPVKTVLIITLIYYFFFSNWLDQVSSTRAVAVETMRRLFLGYVGVHIVYAAFYIGVRRLPLSLVQWSVFTIGLLDGILLASLTLVTGGFDSIIYWVFLGLILHHAISIPLAVPQLVLNLLVSSSYLLAGLVDLSMSREEIESLARLAGRRSSVDLSFSDNPTEPFILRLVVLLLWTLCCYGVQALFEKQRRAAAEAQEFAVKQERLETAGRLAAEIAHQIKNPLGIISNAAYLLQRAVQEGRKSASEQVQIIREEVERADRIITELMGYAQLAEGKIERLQVTEELDRAISEVFPPGAPFDIKVRRNYAAGLPTLLMQRGHFSGVFVNLLQNAREALDGRGWIEVSARYGEGYSVVVTVEDNGPGIPPDKIEHIFEAYFTTREKGTGLGLAIVKHNMEFYGGSVRVESVLGKGTRFILQFPGKTLMKLAP